jgi:Uncharacterized conserved protein (DUF2358)
VLQNLTPEHHDCPPYASGFAFCCVLRAFRVSKERAPSRRTHSEKDTTTTNRSTTQTALFKMPFSILAISNGRRGRILRSLVVVVLLLSQQQTPTAFLTTTVLRREAPPRAAAASSLRPLSMVSPTTPTNNNEHELRIGKALDTLRADYQTILTANPDFSLYDESIEVVDPSGVKLHGLRNYKAAFHFIHAIIRVVYCPAQSELSYRMCYDKARSNIRISWNAKIVPRSVMFGTGTQHIDGISVYEMNADTGRITQHRIERLLLNDNHVAPKEGVIERLRAEHAVVVPSFYASYHYGGSSSSSSSGSSSSTSTSLSSHYNHQPRTATSRHNNRHSRTALHALEASDREPEFASGSSNSNNPAIDLDALESRNRSRQKFGLKPLSPEEFSRLQLEIDVLSDETTRKIAVAAEERQLQKAAQQQQQQRRPGLFEKAMSTLNDTCESNFDCERPQVCCDFIFQKRCCSSGAFVGREMPRLVPVPADNPSYQDPRMRRQRQQPPARY